MVNIDDIGLGGPTQSLWLYASIRAWDHKGDAHSRKRGANKPHGKEHEKRNRLDREGVNDQAIAPHANCVNAEREKRLAHTLRIEKAL
jgi:hypothetical protein